MIKRKKQQKLRLHASTSFFVAFFVAFFVPFFVAILMFSSPSHAYVFVSGYKEATLPVTLDNPTVKFYWDGNSPELRGLDEFAGGQYEGQPDEEIMEALLLAAMDLWNKVPQAYVQLVLEKDPNAVQDPEDEINSISVGQIDSQSTAAFAIPIIANNRIIIDCDISIAARSRTARTLAYTIAHEIGHCLGLGHAHTNYGSIMGYSRDTFNLKLGADDMAGLIYLYPDARYVDSSPLAMACGALHTPLHVSANASRSSVPSNKSPSSLHVVLSNSSSISSSRSAGAREHSWILFLLALPLMMGIPQRNPS